MSDWTTTKVTVIELPYEALLELYQLVKSAPRPSLRLRAAAARQRENRFREVDARMVAAWENEGGA